MRHVLRHRVAAILFALTLTFGSFSSFWFASPAIVTVASDPGEGTGGG